jgi:hypothetical protein
MINQPQRFQSGASSRTAIFRLTRFQGKTFGAPSCRKPTRLNVSVLQKQTLYFHLDHVLDETGF